MTDKEQILQIIFGAIDEINKLRLSDRKLDKTPDVKLYDKDGQLDSLMLVNLIVAIEQNIEEEFEVSFPEPHHLWWWTRKGSTDPAKII